MTKCSNDVFWFIAALNPSLRERLGLLMTPAKSPAQLRSDFSMLFCGISSSLMNSGLCFPPCQICLRNTVVWGLHAFKKQRFCVLCISSETIPSSQDKQFSGIVCMVHRGHAPRDQFFHTRYLSPLDSNFRKCCDDRGNALWFGRM